MIKKEAVKKIADQIIKNVNKVDSTGLYNGKAGLSLSLFLAAEYLQDEHIDEAANKLFLESLLIRNSDISFENGLSGVGYSLLYLLEKEIVDADFDEVFGTQYETIIRSLERIEKLPMGLVNSFQTVYFFTKIGGLKKEDERIQSIIKKFFEGVELYLTVQFLDFEDIRYINSKLLVLNIFKVCLKLVDYAGYNKISRSLLDIYASMYRKGWIISSLETGFYLRKLAIKNNSSDFDDVIRENIINGANNIYTETLSLRERIDLATILSDIQNEKFQENMLLPEIEQLDNDKVVVDLLLTINEKYFPYGYGAGLSRLLIYAVSKQTELL